MAQTHAAVGPLLTERRRFGGRMLHVVSLLILGASVSSTDAAPYQGPTKAPRVIFRPDTLPVSGDVLRSSDDQAGCKRRTFQQMVEGAVILGVNPSTCMPGSRASRLIASVPFSNVGSSRLVVVRVYAANQSPEIASSGPPAVITVNDDTLMLLRLNGREAWPAPAQDGAVDPLITTFQLQGNRTYSIAISVPPGEALEIQRIELALYEPPDRTVGVAYSPYRDCQLPGDTSLLPSYAEVRSDLLQIRDRANAIRVYSSRGPNADAARIARGLNLAVYAGAWIDGAPGGGRGDSLKRKNDDLEIDSLVALTSSLGLTDVLVGSEYLQRHGGGYGSAFGAGAPDTIAIAYMASMVARMRAKLGTRRVAIGSAELGSSIFNWKTRPVSVAPEYRPVLDQLDFVFVHFYPFWDSASVDTAAATVGWMYDRAAEALAAAYPDHRKRLFIGETGWPTAGMVGAANGSVANGTRYLAEFLSLAERKQIDFFYFSFADELWKRQDEGVQGQSWGYTHSDRTAKIPIQSMLIPSSELPSRFAPDSLPSAPLALCDSAPCIFDDWPYRRDALFLPTGFTGDVAQVRLYQCDRTDPRHGAMSARASIDLGGRRGGGGVAWLAAGSWDSVPVRFDTTKVFEAFASARQITLRFSAKGTQGGERVRFGMTYGNATGEKTDWIELSNTWRDYTLSIDPVKARRFGIRAGFWWSSDRDKNSRSRYLEFLLDNIRYEASK